MATEAGALAAQRNRGRPRDHRAILFACMTAAVGSGAIRGYLSYRDRVADLATRAVGVEDASGETEYRGTWDTRRRAEEAGAHSYPDHTPRAPDSPFKLNLKLDRLGAGAKARPLDPSAIKLDLPPLPTAPAPPPPPDPQPLRPATAEVTELTPLPDSIGNLYFVGLYHNTGETIIDAPRVELVLWSADRRELKKATGFADRHQLGPGETTGIKVLFTKAPAYAEVSSRLHPQTERYPRQRPKLRVHDVSLARDRYSGYRVSGSVDNEDERTAQYVQLIALLYDAQDRLAGMDARFIAPKLLPSGGSARFSVEVPLTRGHPTRVEMDYEAMVASTTAP